MAIDAVSPYAQTATATEKSTKKNASNTLAMDDFFKLMVAQLSNQDMNNPMDNSQFIAQMAQFSMVQALSDLSDMSSTAYSVSLIGKEVTVAQTNQDGSLSSITGIAEGVNLYNGASKVIVDGAAYDLSSIMVVKQPNIIIPDSTLSSNAQAESQPVVNVETKVVENE